MKERYVELRDKLTAEAMIGSSCASYTGYFVPLEDAQDALHALAASVSASKCKHGETKAHAHRLYGCKCPGPVSDTEPTTEKAGGGY